MTENIGLIVRVRAEAQSGYLDRLRRDIAGTVHDGAKAAMSMPISTRRVFGDVGKNIRDQVQDAARSPSPIRTPAKDGKARARGDMGPMSGVLGKGAGVLGPLAALTIVGQGMFDMVKKAVGILSQASPALGASLKLIQRTLMMTLKPIGDLLASFLRPIARTLREMHRRAHQAALQKGRPGSREYAKEYYNVLLGEARDRLFEWLSKKFKDSFLGTLQGLSLGDFVNMSGPGIVSKIMGYDLGKAVDDFLRDVGGSLQRAGRDVWNGLAGVGNWLSTNVWGAIRGVGESVWNGLTGIGNWLVVDVGGSLQRVGREIWNGLAGVGNWLSTNVWGAIRSVGESIWNGLTGIGTWLANDVWRAIRGVGESVWNGLVGVGTWLANDIWGAIRSVGESVWNGLTGVGNWLSTNVWGAIRSVGESIWNGLVGVGNWLSTNVWGAIRTVGESVWNGLAGVGNWLANDVWGAIRSVGESIWNGLAGIGQWFADVIRNLFNHVVDSILSRFGLGGRGGSGGKWLPWFADGGYVPPTPGGRIIGVAESGEGEWIVPDSQVQGFARSVLGGGGTVINNYLTLSGTVIGVDDLERRVKRIMDASARESRRR